MNKLIFRLTLSAALFAFPAAWQLSAASAVAAGAAAQASDAGPAFCEARTHSENVHIQNDGGTERWTESWRGSDCSVELRAEGAIEFNDDATGIQKISAGGYLDVEVRQGGTRRQIRVTPSGGAFQYVYKVNGAERPFDNEAKAWFATLLLEIERSSGVGAKARVRRLLEKGGPDAVLEEINHLRNDYVRGIYFESLLATPSLPAPVVARALRQAGEQIAGDYEKAKVLMTVAGKYPLQDEASRTAFLHAADGLKSDYEHARVLIELLGRPDLSAADVELALRSAAGIQGDYEKSRVLLALVDQKRFEQSYLDAYLKAAASIRSDYEKSQALQAPLRKYTLNPEQVSQVLDAAATLRSNHEKLQVLGCLRDQGSFDDRQANSYLKLVDSMTGDYERSQALLGLLKQDSLSKEALNGVLDDTGHIHSSYEKSTVLIALSRKYPLEGALRDKYITIANGLGDYERDRALAEIAKRASN